MLILIKNKISGQTLIDLCKAHFGNFVKFVADIERNIIAAGGDMHADEEDILLKDGSQQQYLWGANLYPENEPEKRIIYESFINIRPLDNNMSMTIQDPQIQHKVKSLAERLLLSPEDSIQLEK